MKTIKQKPFFFSKMEFLFSSQPHLSLIVVSCSGQKNSSRAGFEKVVPRIRVKCTHFVTSFKADLEAMDLVHTPSSPSFLLMLQNEMALSVKKIHLQTVTYWQLKPFP